MTQTVYQNKIFKLHENVIKRKTLPQQFFQTLVQMSGNVSTMERRNLLSMVYYQIVLFGSLCLLEILLLKAGSDKSMPVMMMLPETNHCMNYKYMLVHINMH